MSAFFYRESTGERLRAAEVEALGVPLALAPELGFLPLAIEPPPLDQWFERALDAGTAVEGGRARVVWEVIEREVEAVRADLLAHLAAERWRREVAGCAFGGVRLQTDRESRGNLTGAALRADLAERRGQPYGVTWKGEGGAFVTLGPAEVIAAAFAAEAHVNACFAREAELTKALETAPDLAALRAVAAAMATGWPPN